MDLKRMVSDAFNKELKQVYAEKHEVRKFLLEHPRKHVCLNNLVQEIKLMEMKTTIKLDRARIEMLGKTYAHTFSKLALNHKEQELQTDLQKSLSKRKWDEIGEIEQEVQNNVEIHDRSVGLGDPISKN